jgi:hypothetical protein
MGHNRRADGDGLWIESHKRSEAETCKNPRGSIAHSLKGCGIPFVNGVEDVKTYVTGLWWVLSEAILRKAEQVRPHVSTHHRSANTVIDLLNFQESFTAVP